MRLASKLILVGALSAAASVVGWRLARPRPAIVFDFVDKDLGEGPRGNRIRTGFQYRNTGQSTLHVGEATATCGCTAVSVTTPNVAPQESGHIVVEIDTARVPEGRNVERVTLKTNDPSNPLVELRIVTSVVSEFVFSDTSIDFGKVTLDQLAVRDITVTVRADSAARISAAESTDEAVSVELLAGEGTIGRYRLRLSGKPDARVGLHSGVIIAKTTSRYMPELRVPVRGEVVRRD